MKNINKIIVVIWMVLFIILAFALAILPIANSNSYYMNEHKRNDVINELALNCNINITEEELNLVNKNMIDFLYGRSYDMQYKLEDGTNFFSSQAISHMKDVKTLFVNGIIISFVLLGIFVILSIYIIMNFKKIRINYNKTYRMICLVIVVILAIVVCYALIDFDQAFTLFHKIIFPNQDKFSDSFFTSDDTLITVLPINFFMKIGIIIASIYLFLIVLGFVLTIVLNKISRKVSI